MIIQVIKPRTAEDLESIFDLRYEVLRKPWNQPRGSEKDLLENDAIQAMMLDEAGKTIAAGRLQMNSVTEAQVRYMCVKLSNQKLGLGTYILEYLEHEAKIRNAETIVLNARKEVSTFYIKFGYIKIAEAPTLFGSIEHIKMQKIL